jgi:myosin heavy subunit
LVTVQIVSGSARQTQYQVPQNPEQSTAIRDALAKTLYARFVLSLSLSLFV